MQPRQCCRPGCSTSAVATLTFVYAESTAVVGPLATSQEPHSWDLCHDHAMRITVPRGWEMLRSERSFAEPPAEDHELTALAEAVREVGGRSAVPTRPDAFSAPDHFGREHVQDLGDVPGADAPGGRHRARAGFVPRPATDSGPRSARRGEDSSDSPAASPGRGRRGHLRVLPDPVD